MSAGISTLSPKGRINSVPEKTDQLIAYFFASDVHQSYIFDGSITNLQDIIQLSMHDIPTLKQRLRTALEFYLGPYYDQVLVNVGDDIATNPSNRITIYLQITVTQDGKDYEVANELITVNGKFEKIQKLNNTGNISDIYSS